MTLRLTPRALAELDEILSYIAVRAPDGALRIERRIQATCEALSHNPDLGRRTSNPRLRRIATTPYPYLIFHERRAQDVVIIAVRHGARDPSSMPGA